MAEGSTETVAPPVPLKKDPYHHEETIRKAMTKDISETEARNEVAAKLKEMRRDPMSRSILKGERMAVKKAEEESLIDPLTGLRNRRGLDEDLRKAFKHTKRTDESLTVLMIDVDYFKVYNDTHGHQAGDILLRQIADVLRKVTRETDTAARYGGEEFTVILPLTDHLT